MKAIYIENTKKFLKVKENENGEYYYCPKDNILLFSVNKDGDFEIISSCSHFQWFEVDAISYMQNLRQFKKYVIAEISDDFSINILVPKLQ